MKKLTWGEKLSFGAGAFGKDLVYALVATFIFVYFTDVCYIAPATVGVIFLIARIFDAVNDPVMGLIVDNTRSRLGKFKPWLIIGTLVNAVVLVLLFCRWQLTPSGMIAYAAITYILWGLTYTIMDIPYWSMVPDLGSTVKERNEIAAIPRLFASTAWLLVGGCGLWTMERFGGGNPAQGYFHFAILIAVLFIGGVALTVFHVPVTHQTATAAPRPRTTVREMLRVLLRNDQVMCVLFISVIFNLMVQFNGGVAIYFFKNVLEENRLIAPYLFSGSLAQIAGIFCYPLLAARMTRGRVVLLASSSSLLAGVALFLTAALPPEIAVAGSLLLGFGGGLMLPLLTVMLADGVDYGEAKLGSRNESILFSTQTFVVKLASALSGFIIGLGLKAADYAPDLALGTGGKQILTVMMAGLPMLMVVIYLIVYWKFYHPTRVVFPR